MSVSCLIQLPYFVSTEMLYRDGGSHQAKATKVMGAGSVSGSWSSICYCRERSWKWIIRPAQTTPPCPSEGHGISGIGSPARLSWVHFWLYSSQNSPLQKRKCLFIYCLPPHLGLPCLLPSYVCSHLTSKHLSWWRYPCWSSLEGNWVDTPQILMQNIWFLLIMKLAIFLGLEETLQTSIPSLGQ